MGLGWGDKILIGPTYSGDVSASRLAGRDPRRAGSLSFPLSLGNFGGFLPRSGLALSFTQPPLPTNLLSDSQSSSTRQGSTPAFSSLLEFFCANVPWGKANGEKKLLRA